MRIVTSEVVIRASGQMGYVDLTDELGRAVKDSGVTDGCSVAFCAHTTCNLFINELEDGALADLRARIDGLVPAGIYYAHDDLERRTQNLQPGERSNGRAHVIQMLLGGTSQTIPVSLGEPLLGRWQRLLLLELDEPQGRTCVFQVWGT
jgi:secondary thiamine-phosphate synthase enzyme